MGGEQPEQPASAEARDRTARGRILAAAERLFAERGFDHTSTALIAAEARVPQGLIFYHFKTKMELLLAVIRGDQAGLLDGLLPAPAPAARSRFSTPASIPLARTSRSGKPARSSWTVRPSRRVRR